MILITSKPEAASRWSGCNSCTIWDKIPLSDLTLTWSHRGHTPMGVWCNWYAGWIVGDGLLGCSDDSSSSSLGWLVGVTNWELYVFLRASNLSFKNYNHVRLSFIFTNSSVIQTLGTLEMESTIWAQSFLPLAKWSVAKASIRLFFHSKSTYNLGSGSNI